MPTFSFLSDFSLHGHDIGKPCSDPARCPVRVRVVVNPLPSPLPLPSLQASCCAPSPSVLRTSNLLAVWFLFKPSIEVPLSVFSPGTAVGAEPGGTGVSSSLQQPCCWATLAGVDSHAGDPGRVRVRLGSALPLSQPSTPYTTGLNACSQVISTLPKKISAPIRKGFPTEMNGGWTPQWRNIHLCTLFFPRGCLGSLPPFKIPKSFVPAALPGPLRNRSRRRPRPGRQTRSPHRK